MFVGHWFVLYIQFAGLFTINATVFGDQRRELHVREKNSLQKTLVSFIAWFVAVCTAFVVNFSSCLL